MVYKSKERVYWRRDNRNEKRSSAETYCKAEMWNSKRNISNTWKKYLESTTECDEDDLIEEQSFLEASDDDEFIVSSDDDDDCDFYPYCTPDEEEDEIAEMLKMEEEEDLELVPSSDYEF